MDRTDEADRDRDEAWGGGGVEEERRKAEEANGRGAATGVLVHGLVTQEKDSEEEERMVG